MAQINQKTTGSMAYPKKGTLNRLLFKTPLFLWRSGLGPLLSHPLMGGSRMLAITTFGRISAGPRHTILSCASAGGKEYVCSGWGTRSDWVKNILANPLVTIQVGSRTYPARAYRVHDREEFSQVAEVMFLTGGDSHFEPWLEAYGIGFDRDDMIEKRDRLHVFGFNPVEGTGPAPLKADLRWIWLLVISLALAFWALPSLIN